MAATSVVMAPTTLEYMERKLLNLTSLASFCNFDMIYHTTYQRTHCQGAFQVMNVNGLLSIKFELTSMSEDVCQKKLLSSETIASWIP